MTPASTETVWKRLRDATNAEHEAIEEAVAWESRAGDPRSYGRWLLRLHSFHARWEPLAATALAEPAFFEPRRKLHLLAADLASLGSSAPTLEDVPPWPWPVGFTSRADVLGSMYVLEGSTLGGQIIAARAKSAFGFAPLYHSAYGSRTGVMWQSFREKLERDLAGELFDQVSQSARSTFNYLRALIVLDPLADGPLAIDHWVDRACKQR